MAEKVDITPSLSKIGGVAKRSLWGGAGGFAVLAGRQVLGGPLGSAVGGIAAGSVIGGTTGEIIATTALMDAVIEAGLS